MDNSMKLVRCLTLMIELYDLIKEQQDLIELLIDDNPNEEIQVAWKRIANRMPGLSKKVDLLAKTYGKK